MATINKYPKAGSTIDPSTAKLNFLMGTKADLANKASDSIVGGAFYLTTDTHELFVGNSDHTLDQLNNIIILEDKDSIEAKPLISGRFAYKASANELYYCTGSAWVLVNHDNDSRLDITTTNISVTGGANVATVASSITADSGVRSSTGSFSIKGAGVATVQANGNEITVSVTEKADKADQIISTDAGTDNNTAKIHLSGVAGSSSDAIIKGGTGVTVAGDANGVTISRSSDIQTLSVSDSPAANMATISLSQGGGSVTFAGEGTVIDVTGDADNKTVTIKGSALEAKSNALSLNSDTLSISFKDKANNTVSGSADLSGYAHVGDSYLKSETYTKGEVDNLFTTLNAVEYRGVLNAGDALPTTNVKNGYMYLIGTYATAIGGTTYKPGDIIVAQGEEGTDGYIPTSDIVWQGVVNTNNTDTLYDIKDVATGFGFYETVGGTETLKKNILLVSGDTEATGTKNVNTGITIDYPTGGNGRFAFKHKQVNGGNAVASTAETAATQAAKGSLTINAVTGITTDAAGHITGFNTKAYTVTDTDTHNGLKDVTATRTVANNKATLTVGVEDNDGASKSASVVFEADANISLSAGSADNTAKIGLVWGTF